MANRQSSGVLGHRTCVQRAPLQRSSAVIFHLSTKSPHTSATHEALSEDEIRDYAYHLYDQGGRAAGKDLDNWLEAKACLSSGIPKSESHIRLHQNSFKARG
jgi:DUF2934 family protein